MPEQTYDLIVIGSGPGGYVCAIRAAQNGLKTALVEESDHLGGCCLNIGCIPSKALLHSSEMYHFAKERGARHGLKFDSLALDTQAMMKNKDEAVERLRTGVKTLLEKRGVDICKGRGRLLGEGKVQAGERELMGKHIVIATGSRPTEPPFLKFDSDTIVSSTEALSFAEPPEKLVVVGGGAIGLELGSVWSRLGSQTTVLEFLPRIAPTFDEEISKQAQRMLKKQGLKIDLNVEVKSVEKTGGKATVKAEKKGKPVEYEADKILVAVGRTPNVGGLGLEDAGVVTTDRGFIKVDPDYHTSVDNIFAIGDVIGGAMLAHKAEEEGVAVADMIAGRYAHVNYDAVPNVIYTSPEIASVGLSEQAAKEQDIHVKVGKFPISANGRALASDAAEGIAKVIADAETDLLLGVQLVAVNASEIIAEAAAHIEYGGSAEDLARVIHAHPTISEALKEAALAVDGASIHSL